MSVTMQGAWTISVKSKNAALPQRFVISGASTGNGTYAGVAATPAVAVSGAQWTITIQHNPTGPTSWTPSAMRFGVPTSVGGQVKCDILSNDAGGDEDYDDLVLTCSMTAAPSEYVIYGNVETYKGRCLFNHCGPSRWVVIDSRLHLKAALLQPSVRTALEELYPDRILEYVERPGVIRPPRPEPDPAPFIPLMIPLGGDAAVNAGVERSLARAALGSALTAKLAPHVRNLSRLVDIYRLACTSDPAPGILLRFLEYDRTADELVGGPYSGAGNRLPLGLAATDEIGNYLFRFTQTLSEVAEEVEDQVAGGAPLSTQLRPDLIAQVISPGPSAVLYESALFPDIPNLKRIDLCIPDHVLNPGPTSCQGGRAIQAIGNIFTIAGVGNTFDAAGRVTATNASGPQITRGAWAGTLDLFACFLELPAVTSYTIRFRRPGGGWSFVQELYRHVKFSDIAPGYTGTKVGPDPRDLAIDGGPLVNEVPSYLNIEASPEWAATHRLRKAQLSSSYYENLLYGPNENPRSIDFRIEGYDSAGQRVPGAVDQIRLLVDNRPVSGDIAEIMLGGASLGECALFELPSPNAPLTVRFRVHHAGGFVASYGLSVARGSNTGVPVSDTTPPPQPLTLAYDVATHGDFFFGTLNALAPDADHYVLAELQSTGGAWLPAGQTFCAFEFAIAATPRTTNGYGHSGGYTLDKELVGISYTP